LLVLLACLLAGKDKVAKPAIHLARTTLPTLSQGWGNTLVMVWIGYFAFTVGWLGEVIAKRDLLQGDLSSSLAWYLKFVFMLVSVRAEIQRCFFAMTLFFWWETILCQDRLGTNTRKISRKAFKKGRSLQAAIPIVFASAPAKVSTQCDEFKNNLALLRGEEIIHTGDATANRIDALFNMLDHVNNRQGIGFIVSYPWWAALAALAALAGWLAGWLLCSHHSDAISSSAEHHRICLLPAWSHTRT
jgi:hypothetical protein